MLVSYVMLSHWLGSGFEPLEWQTRDGEFQDRIKANGFNKNLKGTIFVDDICDSSLTIKQIKEIIPNSRWAVLHQKADIEHRLVLEGVFGQVHKVTTTKKLMDDNQLATLKIVCCMINWKDAHRKEVKGMTYQEEIDWIVTHPDRNEIIKNIFFLKV